MNRAELRAQLAQLDLSGRLAEEPLRARMLELLDLTPDCTPMVSSVPAVIPVGVAAEGLPPPSPPHPPKVRVEATAHRPTSQPRILIFAVSFYLHFFTISN